MIKTKTPLAIARGACCPSRGEFEPVEGGFGEAGGVAESFKRKKWINS